MSFKIERANCRSPARVDRRIAREARKSRRFGIRNAQDLRAYQTMIDSRLSLRTRVRRRIAPAAALPRLYARVQR